MTDDPLASSPAGGTVEKGVVPRTQPFGGPVRFVPEAAADGTSATSPAEDMDLVRRTLADAGHSGLGLLRMYRPRPTAAFSPRDTTAEHYASAAQAMRGLGFEPVERLAGGQLAVYDGNALVIDLIAPHAEPRLEVLDRFRRFAGAIAAALAAQSIDARVGAVAGEYCPGDYSVNGAGRIKLAGVAQRIVRRAYHLGAVISILPSPSAKAAVVTAYGILGIAFDPATFGAARDLAPHVSFGAVRTAFLHAIAEHLEVQTVSR